LALNPGNDPQISEDILWHCHPNFHV